MLKKNRWNDDESELHSNEILETPLVPNQKPTVWCCFDWTVRLTKLPCITLKIKISSNSFPSLHNLDKVRVKEKKNRLDRIGRALQKCFQVIKYFGGDALLPEASSAQRSVTGVSRQGLDNQCVVPFHSYRMHSHIDLPHSREVSPLPVCLPYTLVIITVY